MQLISSLTQANIAEEKKKHHSKNFALNEMLGPEVSPQVHNLPSSQANEHTHGTECKPLHPLVGALVGITQTLLTRTEVIHLCDNVGDHLLDAAEVGLDRLELLLRLDGGPVAGVGADLDIEIDFAGGVGDSV
jgi:hypothetical protein